MTKDTTGTSFVGGTLTTVSTAGYSVTFKRRVRETGCIYSTYHIRNQITKHPRGKCEGVVRLKAIGFHTQISLDLTEQCTRRSKGKLMLARGGQKKPDH